MCGRGGLPPAPDWWRRRGAAAPTRRRWLRRRWCPVAGSVEAGETPEGAAAREVLEETGLSLPGPLEPTRIRILHAGTGDPPRGHVGVFVGFPSPQAEVRLKREHSDYRWASFSEAVALVSLEGQRRLFREVERVFVRGEAASELVVGPPAGAVA